MWLRQPGYNYRPLIQQKQQKRKKGTEAPNRLWCVCVYHSMYPEAYCDARMGPADLYTQTSAQTVNNSTHASIRSHESNLLTHPAITVHTKQLQSSHATRICRQRIRANGHHQPVCEATSRAAAEGVVPESFGSVARQTQFQIENIEAQSAKRGP